MEEPRRLQFTTIAPTDSEKKKAAVTRTVRINLNLNEANDETCPEFSYVELLKNAEGGDRSGVENGENGLEPDPFGDYKEDDKLAEIAKQFEAKYGPKPGGGKRKPERIQDLVDLGEGYDESDNFIDNSEAYDEIVPACLTTKLGGFYINSGVLDFREVSDDSADEFLPNNGSAKKKRKVARITSDSESESDVPVKKKRGPKPKKKFAEGFASKKRKRLSAEGEKLFKRPKKPIDKWKRKKKSPTVSELLKQQAASTSSVNGIDSPQTGLLNGANIDSAIESVVNKGLPEDSNSQSDERSSWDNPDTAPSLPSGLSQNLLDTIARLKKAATVSREGKCRFFTHEVNRMLLVVELESQKMTCGTRQIIYNHLTAFLPCSKETLLKRAKKLRLNENDDKLKEPIQRLRNAINATMPAQLERYAQECRLTAQVRMLEGSERSEAPKEEASTESDEDDKCSNEGGEKKKHMSPRRKFEWSTEIRTLLCEIVQIKMRTYHLSKLRAQSAEEYLKAFLESETKPIWPKGWMQTRMLYKESRSAHEPWTNPGQRLKKPMAVNKGLVRSSDIKPIESIETKREREIPTGVVSSTEDPMEFKPGHSMTQEQGQVSSTDRAGPSSGIPTLLDYAGPPTGNSTSHVGPSSGNPTSHVGTSHVGPSSGNSTAHVGPPAGNPTSLVGPPTGNPTSHVGPSSGNPTSHVGPSSGNPTSHVGTSSSNFTSHVGPTAEVTGVDSTVSSSKSTPVSAARSAHVDSTATKSTHITRPANVPSVDSTASSIKSTYKQSAQPVNKPITVDSTSSGSKPQETDTHNIAMEILKSMRQIPQSAIRSPGPDYLPQNNPREAHTSNNSFLAQFQKYASSSVSHVPQDLSPPSHKRDRESPNKAATLSSRTQLTYKADKGSQLKANVQVSPPFRSSPPDKAQVSPFTLLNKQLEMQQQQQKQRQSDHSLQKDNIPAKNPAKSPLVSPSGKHYNITMEGRQSPTSLLRNQQIHQHIQQQNYQQNYLNMLQKSHGIGQSKPPQPPSAAQTAKRQSLLAAAISHSDHISPPAASSTTRLSHNSVNTQDRHHQDSTGHSPNALSKKTLQTVGQQKSRVSKPVAPPPVLTSNSIPAHSSAWNLLSFVNSTANPIIPHSTVGHSGPVGTYPLMAGGKKTPSPTSSLYQQTRSPDSSRAVVSSTVPYSQLQLSPHSGISPHGSPITGMQYPSSGNPRTAASPHNSSRPSNWTS